MDYLFMNDDATQEGLLHLLNNLACGVVVFEVGESSRVRIRYVNDGYYTMLNTTREERPKRFVEHPLEAIHCDDVPGIIDELSASIKEGRALNYYMRLQNGRGSYTWVNIRANEVGRHDDVLVFYAVYSDITEERRFRERLEEATATLKAAVSYSSLHAWEYFPNERRVVFMCEKNPLIPYLGESVYFPDNWIEGGMVHSDDEPIYRAMYKKIDDGAKSASCDARIKYPDGWHWERINLISIYGIDGVRTKVIGIAEDLDDYKELETRFSIAAAQSGLTTWTYYIVEKKMLMDTATSNIHNCPTVIENAPENLFKMLAVHPDDEASVRETLQAISSGAKGAICDARWREDENGWRWRRVFYTVIFDKNDCPIKAIGSSIDISEQKEAEEKYRKYKESVAAIAPNTLGCFRLNITKNLCYDGTSRYADIRALNKDGTADSFLRTLKSFIPDVCERENFSSLFARSSLITAFGQGRTFLTMDYKSSMEKKTPKWLCTCINMIKNPTSGDIEGLIYAVDINEKKLAEQKTNKELAAALKAAKTASEAKGDFLSRMSHDMRTPLNAIIGLSSLAMENKTDAAEMASYMEKINASGQYLLGLINDILNMSKIESKKMRLNLDYADADIFFKTVKQIINPIMKARNINFSFDIDDFGKKYILVDAIHLQQIFINLLSNSAKFTPCGGNVSCTVKIIENRKGSVVSKMVFRDDGIGMSKEFLTRVFEPFEQEESGCGGTGLGLTIVKSLTELMGGTLSIESEKGRGTSVTLTLEIDVADTLPCGKNLKQCNAESLKGKRVLVAEDQELNVLVVSKILESRGIIAESAPNGYEVCRKFEDACENYYDAILMDIRMPVMNGLEATKKIRAMKRSDARTIPIIAMTANAFEEDREMAKKSGMNGHAAKPIVPDQLIEMLCSLIKHQNKH